MRLTALCKTFSPPRYGGANVVLCWLCRITALFSFSSFEEEALDKQQAADEDSPAGAGSDYYGTEGKTSFSLIFNFLRAD